MKIAKYFFLLSFVILQANFLICMDNRRRDVPEKTFTNSLPANIVKNAQQKESLNSWANVVKALPAITEAAAKPQASISKQQVQSIKKNSDEPFLSWVSGSGSELPNPIIGNAFSVVFDYGQIKVCKIDKTKPVLIFDLQALRHTLRPWPVAYNQSVNGGHFARYLSQYSDSSGCGDIYFFNTEKTTYVGECMRPFSRHQQHPNCEIVLWATKDSYKKEWYPAAIKTVFDESVAVFDVLNTAANYPVDICEEADGSSSFVIDARYLPCFKINTRWNAYNNVYDIISIYPWGNNFQSITDNMYQYFYNQFIAPSDSVLYEIRLQK